MIDYFPKDKCFFVIWFLLWNGNSTNVMLSPLSLSPEIQSSDSRSRVGEHKLLLICFLTEWKRICILWKLDSTLLQTPTNSSEKLHHFTSMLLLQRTARQLLVTLWAESPLEVAFLIHPLPGANANTDELELENTVTASDLSSFTDNGLWRHLNLSKQPHNLSY